MKRLILLLLALSITLFIACGNGNTSGATEDNASVASSLPENESSTPSEDSSVSAEPSDNSSEEPSKEPEPIFTPGTNIAPYGKYVISELFKVEFEEPWLAESEFAYPDEDNITMTDGKFPTIKDFYDEAWAGFNYQSDGYAEKGYHNINFKFDQAYMADNIKIYVATSALNVNIGSPATIEVYASNDGENWSVIGTATPANEATEEFADVGLEVVEIPVTTPAEATQYQLRFVLDEAWMFVSEVEIYI